MTNDINKRLYLDIETAPILGYAYRRYEAEMFAVERDWYVQSVAWKWSNKDQIHCMALPDFKGYMKHPFDDSELVKVVHGLLNEAELVCGHNSDKFDLKKLNTRFIIAGLDEPRPYKTADTIKIAKNKFGFSSNSLNEICRQLGLPQKIEEEKGLWKKCEDAYITKDLSPWKRRKAYNKRDVEIGDMLYMRFRNWISNFPVLHPDNGKCRVCGNSNLIRRGYGHSKKGEYPKYQCMTCGSWSKGETTKVEWDIKQ